MAFGIVHHFPGGTKENYEASIAAVHPANGLPDGQIFHAAGRVARRLDDRGRARVEAELGEVPRRHPHAPHASGDRGRLPDPSAGDRDRRLQPSCPSGPRHRRKRSEEATDMLANNRISAVLVSTDLEREPALLREQGRTDPLAGDDQEPPGLRVRRRHDAADLRPRRAATTPTTPRCASGRPTSTRTSPSSRPTASSSRSTTPRRSRPSTTSSPSPGIGRSAWFKDPDGNTIAVFQPA